MADIVAFIWPVSVGGYQWEDKEEGRFLAPVAPPRASSPRWRYYEPFAEHPALFRTFADLSPTEDAILDFANRYGHLGAEELARPEEAGAQALLESSDTWAREIEWMKAVAGIWDATSSGNKEALATHIHLRAEAGAPPNVWYTTPPGGRPLRNRATGFQIPVAVEWLTAFRPAVEQLSEAALLVVQDQINIVIRERCTVGLVRARQTDHPAMSIVPRDLLGAMWLQFARAVSEEKRYRRCQECGKWFELEPSTARTNRLFCSNACRVRAYRNRRERAKQLSEEGYSVEAVAEQLGTDIETARGWTER